MGKIVLSHMLLHGLDEIPIKDLYVRGNVHIEDGQVLFGENESVCFNTYYNALFYSKYLAYTQIQSINAVIEVCGRCSVELMLTDSEGHTKILDTKVNCDISNFLVFSNVSLLDLPAGGMLFFRVTGFSKQTAVCGGCWEGVVSDEKKISLAIVICTYKREEYVWRNIKLLQQSILKNDQDIQLFVIDNGQTLKASEKEKKNVHIFPNRNYGGSGGFTRGIIEAYKREFTHVLLMDDDIRFEPEVIYRTIQFLRASEQQKRPLMIGGAMLIEDKPTIQFESGAFYENGRLRSIGQGLDLSKVESLLENDKEKHVQYNAWWYCCFPISIVEQIGLPLPFFIKTDDVEYGLRSKANIVLLNGIGVWHTSFSDKYSPYLEYYIKRNELIVSILHHSGDGIGFSMWKLIRAAGKAIIRGDPKTVNFLIWAYHDFLKGPDFFLTVDDEQLHSKLLEENRRPLKHKVYDIVIDSFHILMILIKLLFCYSSVSQEFCIRVSELTSMSFWIRRLEI